MPVFRGHILVCGGTGCASSGSQEVQKAFHEELEKRNLDKEILVVQTGCHGMCEMGPIVVIYPEGTFYCRVQASDVTEIVQEHLVKGRPVPRLLYTAPEDASKVPFYKDIPFYGKQRRIHTEPAQTDRDVERRATGNRLEIHC